MYAAFPTCLISSGWFSSVFSHSSLRLISLANWISGTSLRGVAFFIVRHHGAISCRLIFTDTLVGFVNNAAKFVLKTNNVWITVFVGTEEIWLTQLSCHDIMMGFTRRAQMNASSVEAVPIKESDILIVIKLPLWMLLNVVWMHCVLLMKNSHKAS